MFEIRPDSLFSCRYVGISLGQKVVFVPVPVVSVLIVPVRCVCVCVPGTWFRNSYLFFLCRGSRILQRDPSRMAVTRPAEAMVLICPLVIPVTMLRKP